MFGFLLGLVDGLNEFNPRATDVGATEGSTLFEVGLEVGCEVIRELEVGSNVNPESKVGNDDGWDVGLLGW